jgi:hypothetical protein
MTPRTKMLLILGTALLAALLAWGVSDIVSKHERRNCPPMNPDCGRLPWHT